jgi:hypothetical protein
MMLAYAKGAAMDDGDDLLPLRRRASKPPDLLRYEERYETSATRQTRTKAKVTTNTVRNNIVHRADVGAEIRCLRLAVGQMSRNEWQSYIALKEGVLFEGEGARRWWHVVPLPARSATPEQTARHYGLRVETVNRYERRAREVLNRIRAAAGLTGDDMQIPVWPVVQSDDALLAYLFDERW